MKIQNLLFLQFCLLVVGYCDELYCDELYCGAVVEKYCVLLDECGDVFALGGVFALGDVFALGGVFALCGVSALGGAVLAGDVFVLDDEPHCDEQVYIYFGDVLQV